MITYRIKYKNIISELYIPENHNGTSVIFISGLPSFLGKNNITKSLVESGCAVFQPFYSGSYDSEGYFTPSNCVNDIGIFVEMSLQKSIKELYYDKEINLKTEKIVIIGTSFGSSIVSLSNIGKISKIVLLSPVFTYDQNFINSLNLNFDFKSQMEALLNLLRNGYPISYRIRDVNPWLEFLHGKADSFEIINKIKKVSVPTFVVHGNKDTSIPHILTKKILSNCKNKNIKLITPSCGHSISSYAPSLVKKIVNFINI